MQVSIPISREGTSGVATVFWTVEGVLPSAVDSNDMHNLEGSVVLQHGVSVVNVELKILADNISETDEFMVLRLSAVLPANTQRFRENFTQVVLVLLIILEGNCINRFSLLYTSKHIE